MAATIKDIREKTGLSLATISKYLNGGNLRPENRAKIEAAVAELHYEVNELARGLVTSRTQTIGMVVYGVENLFCGRLIKYVGESLRRRGYGLLICDSNNSAQAEAENVRFLLSKKVAGILVIPVSQDPAFLEPARRAGVPVTLLDRVLPGGGFDCVRIDNYTAALHAVSFLLEKGHRRIAVISSDERLYTGWQRYKGYEAAMKAAGISPVEGYRRTGTHAIGFGHDSMRRLLNLPEPPTAVFMTNYEISLGAVMAVHEAGAACPEQISLLSFDDLLLGHIVEPQLHTVVQPMQQMGDKAVSLLLDRIEGADGPPAEIVLGTQIKEGNSVRVLAPV